MRARSVLRRAAFAAAALPVLALPTAAGADVSAIAFDRNLEIWAVPAAGGEATRIVERANWPAFSPSGDRIAFLGDEGLVSTDIDGSDRRTLLGDKSVAYSGGIDYGPGRVVFAASRSNTASPQPDEIRVVNVDGSGTATVFTAPSTDYSTCCPALSRDGTKIVFALRNFKFYTPDEGLWIMNADGSNPTQVTADLTDGDPVFTADGNRIVFRRAVPNSSGGTQVDLFVMNADGTGVSNLTNDPSRSEQEPALSPAGDMLAFTSERYDESSQAYDSRIDVMRLDGTGRRSLTGDLPGDEGMPTWANVAALPSPTRHLPAAGERFRARPIRRTFVRCPGDAAWRRLSGVTILAVGCSLDVRRGEVEITAAANASNSEFRSALFEGGRFRVVQKRAAQPITDLVLAGPLRRCGESGGVRGRRLIGSGGGRFRIVGRHASAGLGRAYWVVHDRCDRSTQVKVGRGRVVVRDFVKRQTRIVRSPNTYVARPR